MRPDHTKRIQGKDYLWVRDGRVSNVVHVIPLEYCTDGQLFIACREIEDRLGQHFGGTFYAVYKSEHSVHFVEGRGKEIA